jgi:hypothetical protein
LFRREIYERPTTLDRQRSTPTKSRIQNTPEKGMAIGEGRTRLALERFTCRGLVCYPPMQRRAKPIKERRHDAIAGFKCKRPGHCVGGKFSARNPACGGGLRGGSIAPPSREPQDGAPAVRANERPISKAVRHG